MRRLVTWCGFGAILTLFLPAIPWGWEGVLVLALVVLVFAPK